MKKFILLVFVTILFCSQSFASNLKVIDKSGLLDVVKSHKGGKTMVVFWAPWCPHCMRELRTLRDNPDFIKKNNLQVVGLTKENDANFADLTVKDEKFPFKFFVGSKQLYKELMKIDAVPYTQVYGSDCMLVDDEYGSQKLDDLQLMLE